MNTLDMFWEPAVGALVRLRPACKSGIKAFDDHPLWVTKATDIDGHRLFSCETTGPMESRTLKTGRVVLSCPRWTGYYLADELLPEEIAA